MARTVVIGGKEYQVSMKFGTLEKIYKSKSIAKMNNHDKLLTMVLYAVEPNRIGIKPFYTLRGLKNAVEVDELKAIDELMADLISLNRDSKNPIQEGKRSMS